MNLFFLSTIDEHKLKIKEVFEIIQGDDRDILNRVKELGFI